MARRALLISVPGGGIDVSLAARRLTPLLEGLGFGAITVCTGPRATRDGILTALDRLAANSGPGDAVLIHYFGHGGRVRFHDLMSEQVFGYVTTSAATRGAGFEAILDVELSARLSELDSRCGNVTAILDCCYSGELVRSREFLTTRELDAPSWAHEALACEPGTELALDSHPGIVRVCGASPKREAFAAVRGGRHIGRLTEAFITALEECGDRWDRLCWVHLGHRLREHVIEALAMESQWVTLAGPVDRKLFSTEVVDAPGSVAFVPGDAPGRGWIRAGWHQGVSVSDRWAVLDPRASPAAESASRVELRVTKVGRNRSLVEFEPGAAGGPRLLPGLPATPLALAAPFPIAAGPASATAGLANALAASPWLKLDAGEAALRIHHDGDEIHIEQAGHARLVLSDGYASPEVVIGYLEDRARLWSIDRSHAAREPSECPLRWRWSLAEAIDQPLPETGAQLHTGDRICVELSLDADAPPLNWFVSVVLVDVSGRLRLLNTRMPEGIELGRGQRELIGWRVGRRGPQGLSLDWPPGLDPAIARAPARLLILASRRPVELGHLVRPQLRDADAALAVQGLGADTLRARKPEHSRGCAWASIRFEQSASPRP